jgi:carbamoyltransferase
MKILGIASPFGHDPSAALLIDGRVAAAAEEERFTRHKHGTGELPINAVRFCLKQAGIKPGEIDYVAHPWSYAVLRQKRWEYFGRTIRNNPSRAYKKFFRNQKELCDQRRFIFGTLRACGISLPEDRVRWIEHHLAHAASSFYFSGMDEAAVLSMDGGGELTSTLLARGAGGEMIKIKEILAPDSLGNFYATVTDYLGFDRGDGEYKVMGMAPFGDPSKSDVDAMVAWDEARQTYRCNDDYVWVPRNKRYDVNKVYSRKMVREYGLPRYGDGLEEPYMHIAAATQKKLEEITLKLIEAYLKEDLRRHGNLCFAGGVALNVALNRILLTVPYIKRLWVQPAAHDAGASLGAAAMVAAEAGDVIAPMEHAYYGPEFTNTDMENALKGSGYAFKKEADICEKAAGLLNSGEIIGWFQGRMEWGPRALGNRSILGNPTIPGTADRINEIIKFRERWRPFCPSILKEFAADILGSDHPAPFMTIAFLADGQWKHRVPEVVHVDGTCRPQIVDAQTNPKFHRLISAFHKKTGIPVVINTSLNRRGEPMICSPQDALLMFRESGLDFLVMGDFLVKKR